MVAYSSLDTMATSIRLFTAMMLGLTLSGFSDPASLSFSSQQASTPQASAIQKSEQKSTKLVETEAPKPNSPDQNGNYRIGGSVVAPKVIHSVEPKIAKKIEK